MSEHVVGIQLKSGLLADQDLDYLRKQYWSRLRLQLTALSIWICLP